MICQICCQIGYWNHMTLENRMMICQTFSQRGHPKNLMALEKRMMICQTYSQIGHYNLIGLENKMMICQNLFPTRPAKPHSTWEKNDDLPNRPLKPHIPWEQNDNLPKLFPNRPLKPHWTWEQNDDLPNLLPNRPLKPCCNLCIQKRYIIYYLLIFMQYLIKKAWLVRV